MNKSTKETEKAPKKAAKEIQEELLGYVYGEEETQEERAYGLYGYGLYLEDLFSPTSMIELQKQGRFSEKVIALTKGRDDIPRQEYAEEFFREDQTFFDKLHITKEDLEEGKDFEFFSVMMAEATGRAEEYLAHKEPKVREAFIPYIEEAICMADALSIGEPLYDYRIKYGWNDEGFQKRYKEGEGYEYRSPEELSETDREALRYAALQIYYIAEDILGEARRSLRRFALISGFKDELEAAKDPDAKTKIYDRMKKTYIPYPFKGLSKEDIEEGFRKDRAKDFEGVDSIVDYNCWACVEYYFPYLLHRLDYSIYLAFRYSGEEYREYLNTLDFRSDFDRYYEGRETKGGKPVSFEAIAGDRERKPTLRKRDRRERINDIVSEPTEEE